MKQKQTMNKRGQVEIAAGVISLTIMALMGGIGSYIILTENQYVGDSSTNIYYDLNKCSIGNVEKENLVSFKNLKEVRKSGYAPAKCSI